MQIKNNSTELEPLGLSIKKTAEVTGESEWQVKAKLRAGRYRAKKSGRRTIIIFSSIKADVEALPDAKFAPPRRRGLPPAADTDTVA
jgi:hypothetical protein